ncbi:MAG: thermonuclease family protein [Deltaproteobacteria bacterium]|nr:thermonuclease family protein [Deltaproteobacteria bacterium]
MRRVVLVLLLALGCDILDSPGTESDGPAPTPDAPEVSEAADGIPVELTSVVDGDTIHVRLEDGSDERVRYIGIDTPEVAHAEGEVSERFGDEATEENRRLLGDGELRLVLDVEERDRFGRLLAYVYVGEAMVNEALVREGYARTLTIPPNVRHVDRFREAEREARDANLGLWSR